MRPLLLLLALMFHVSSSAQESTREELTGRLVEQIATSLKAGEKLKAWVMLFGKNSELQISATDPKSIIFLVQNNPYPVAWEKLAADELTGIARSVACGKGERLLLAARLASACHKHAQAKDLLLLAVQADPKLADQVGALATQLPDPPAPVKPSMTPMDPAAGSSSPAANAGLLPASVPKRTSQARTERPRLLFDAARLSAVRARGATPEGKKFLSHLKNSKEGDARSYALAFVITGDPSWAKNAIDRVAKTVAGGAASDVSELEGLGELGIVYDWCYSQLSDDQHKHWQAWILKSFDNLKDSYLVPYHNYALRAAWSFALCGYALQGENVRAAELLENAYGKRWRTLIQPACKAGLAGGAWAEGEGYGATSAGALIELAEVARCVEGKDLLSEGAEFFTGRLAFLMFLDQPGVIDGGRRLWLNGDMNRRRNWDDVLQQRLMLQELLRGSELAAFAASYAELPAAKSCQYNSGNFIDVLWRDRGAAQKPLELFKLSHLAWGRGTVLLRSDWSEGATHVGFVAGPLITASHGHADAGHFSLCRNGELLTSAGDYRGTSGAYALDFYKRTISHNCVLIYDPAEKFTVRHASAGNDGGQLWNDSENNLEGARIIAYDARRAYTYICADLTPAYSKNKAALVRRQLLFLRPDTLVISDSVVCKAAGFPKIWQCYLAGQPSATDKSFTTSNGKSKLKADVLLPLDGKVSLLGKQDKSPKVFERTIAQPRGHAGSDDGPAWRAELRPGAARTSDNFLVVLRVYDQGEPAAASLKDKGNQLAISLPGAGEVVLNADGSPGGSVNGKALLQNVVLKEE